MLNDEPTTTSHSTVTQAFTELAPTYEQVLDAELRKYWGWSYSGFVNHFTEMVSARKGELILDVATGTGVIPRALAPHVEPNGSVVGLDITPAMLEQGRHETESPRSDSCVRLVCASGMALPFKDGVFDAVTCGLGTHHMDVPVLLSESQRVLQRGGRLVLADVSASTFWRSFWGGILLKVLLRQYGLRNDSARARAETEAFANVRTAGEWKALLGELGFTQIELHELGARRPWYPSGLTLKAIAA